MIRLPMNWLGGSFTRISIRVVASRAILQPSYDWMGRPSLMMTQRWVGAFLLQTMANFWSKSGRIASFTSFTERRRRYWYVCLPVCFAPTTRRRAVRPIVNSDMDSDSDTGNPTLVNLHVPVGDEHSLDLKDAGEVFLISSPLECALDSECAKTSDDPGASALLVSPPGIMKCDICQRILHEHCLQQHLISQGLEEIEVYSIDEESFDVTICCKQCLNDGAWDSQL
jgi:hypothetical protein